MFDSRLATTSLLVFRSVEDTPGWGKVRPRTKRGQKDRSASMATRGASQAGRESAVITCWRETGLPASLSSESTETPRPLLVEQDTISNTSGTATVHRNLPEKICLRNGRVYLRLISATRIYLFYAIDDCLPLHSPR